MCIDTVSLPNESRYDDISIYCCISSVRPCIYIVITSCNHISSILEMGRYRICKYQCIAPKISRYNDILRYLNSVKIVKFSHKTDLLSPLILFYCNVNSII